MCVLINKKRRDVGKKERRKEGGRKRGRDKYNGCVAVSETYVIIIF